MPKPVRNSPAPNVGAPKPAVESKAAFLAGWAKASGLDATQLRGLASMFVQDFKGANAFRLDQGESYILKYGLQDAAEKLATRPAYR